jgi:hypothetical protein
MVGDRVRPVAGENEGSGPSPVPREADQPGWLLTRDWLGSGHGLTGLVAGEETEEAQRGF